MSFDDAGKDMDLDDEYRRGMPDANGQRQPTACEEATSWIGRDPSHRAVTLMSRNAATNRVTVELRGKNGTYSSDTQLTFDSALRTALMVAYWSGDK